MSSSKRGERFFSIMALIAMAYVLAGFGLLQVLQPDQSSPLTGLVALHGIVFLAWFVLLISQPRLIQTGSIRRHRQFGFASLGLATAIVVLGYLVTRGAYARPDWSIAGMDPAGSVIFPLTDIVNFTIAFLLGFLNRHNAAAHKRLMLLAGLLMLDPAAARFWGALGLDGPLIPISELLLFLALLAYDWKKLGRPHWASALGLLLWVAANILKFTVSGTDAWRQFVATVFG